MNHSRAIRCLIALLPLSLCGCEAIVQSILVPPLLANSLQATIAQNLALYPSVQADAGASQNAVLGQRVILDGSSSVLVLGSGSTQPNPTPPLTFAWTIVSAPVADPAAAGVSFTLTDTPEPQFISPIAGTFVFQLTATWPGLLGIPASDTATTLVDVFAPNP